MNIKVNSAPVDLSDHMSVTAGKDVAFCSLSDGVALLDMRTGTYYSLNAVAAHIWSTLQSPIAIKEIYPLVLARFDVTEAACRADVMALIADMAKAGLVDVSGVDAD